MSQEHGAGQGGGSTVSFGVFSEAWQLCRLSPAGKERGEQGADGQKLSQVPPFQSCSPTSGKTLVTGWPRESQADVC